MIKWLLLPFSGLYGLLTDVRNWLFDNQLSQSVTPAIQTISVGNLTVGGTGKTPMVEFLIEWHSARASAKPFDTATLSRGYGRRTTGFRIATADDTAATIGDEPLQLYRKFGRRVRVCVGERRAEAIELIRQQHPEVSLILLDDAFQHRAVQPQVNLLLTDYYRPFYADHPFPAGRLRERRRGAVRAAAVIVTKCPNDLPAAEQVSITARIRRYTPADTPVFFAGLRYRQPVPFADQPSAARPENVVLVSGLANANPLEDYVRKAFTLKTHHRFADHHAYTRADLDRILAGLPTGTSVVTTEKDWVKLDALLTPDERNRLPLFYLPVAVQFLPGSESGFGQFLEALFLKKP